MLIAWVKNFYKKIFKNFSNDPLPAIFERRLFSENYKLVKERRIPLKIYTFLAFITVTTMGCANKSLGLAQKYSIRMLLTNTEEVRSKVNVPGGLNWTLHGSGL